MWWCKKTLTRGSDKGADLCWWMGFLSERAGKLEEAYRYYTEAYELEPSEPTFWWSLGQVCEERAQVTEALYWYEKALHSVPSDESLGEDFLTQLTRRIEQLRSKVSRL